MAETKKTFDILYSVDVSEHKENKNGLSYLSWSWAWAEVKKRFPDANYKIVKFDGIPYVYDDNTGYMVYTEVTIDGITHEMWLPVMDANNNAMKSFAYDVQTKYKTISVKAATMFDINKTIMRCLTKNLAMFGLGLYIYSGEDLPEEVVETPKNEEKKTSSKKKTNEFPTQPIQELPSDYCTICRLPILDFDGKNKNGNPVHYEKNIIIAEAIQKFGSPICLPCMLKQKSRKKMEATLDGEVQAMRHEDAGDRV